MRNRFTLLASLLLFGLFALTVPVDAQQDPAPSQPDLQAPPSPQQTNATTLKRISELVLLGVAVKTAEGEDIGKVEDLLINAATGNVEYIVLAPNGPSAPTDRLTAVPAAIFAVVDDRKLLVVAMSKSQIDNAPSFERSSWPGLIDRQWQKNVDTYYESLIIKRAEKRA